jgi:hypothetical protein
VQLLQSDGHAPGAAANQSHPSRSQRPIHATSTCSTWSTGCTGSSGTANSLGAIPRPTRWVILVAAVALPRSCDPSAPQSGPDKDGNLLFGSVLRTCELLVERGHKRGKGLVHKTCTRRMRKTAKAREQPRTKVCTFPLLCPILQENACNTKYIDSASRP